MDDLIRYKSKVRALVTGAYTEALKQQSITNLFHLRVVLTPLKTETLVAESSDTISSSADIFTDSQPTPAPHPVHSSDDKIAKGKAAKPIERHVFHFKTGKARRHHGYGSPKTSKKLALYQFKKMKRCQKDPVEATENDNTSTCTCLGFS